jgi:hypothetical protein
MKLESAVWVVVEGAVLVLEAVGREEPRSHVWNGDVV